jgi:hypothetical protein
MVVLLSCLKTACDLPWGWLNPLKALGHPLSRAPLSAFARPTHRAPTDSGLAPAADHAALGRIWYAYLSPARRRVAEI